MGGTAVEPLAREPVQPSSENPFESSPGRQYRSPGQPNDSAIQFPADTPWIKRVKLQSRLLTTFWGRPIYVGATVLLPRDYDREPGKTYPTVYVRDHFSLDPAFNFTLNDVPERPAQRESDGLERPFDFAQAWIGDDFPRMIAVTFQHPTPTTTIRMQ